MVNSKRQISTFWIIFLSVLVLLSIATGVYFYITLNQTIARQQATTITDDNYYKISVENSCQQSMYKIIEDAEGISTALDKVILTTDSSYQQRLLTDVAILSSSMSDNLSTLPLCCGDNASQIGSFANQLYGYSRSLIDNISRGQQLVQQDIATLSVVGGTARAISTELSKIATNNCGMAITNSLRSDGTNNIDSAIARMDSNQLDYGQLDYIGQYAQVESRSIKTGKAIGDKSIKDYLANLVTTSHNEVVTDVVLDSYIDNLVYATVQLEGDNCIQAVVTVDGRLVQMDYCYIDTDINADIDQQSVSDIAQQYCDNAGYQVVVEKVDIVGGIAYVTLCPKYQDATVLADMVIVAVDSNSKVIGVSAKAYLTATDYSDISWGEVTEEQATNLASSSKGYIGCDKVVYSKYGQQLPCLRLQYANDNNTYWILVDSNSGRCVDIL